VGVVTEVDVGVGDAEVAAGVVAEAEVTKGTGFL